MLINYLPILLYMVIAAGLVALIVGLSEILGKKKHTPQKDMAYECGMDPIGDARTRGKVEVHVCRVADVRKPRGFAPGEVLLKRWEAVRVYPKGIEEAAGSDDGG